MSDTRTTLWITNRIVGKSVLDVGCEFGKIGFLVGVTMEEMNKPVYRVTVDIWHPNLVRVRKQRIYEDVLQADARFLPFRGVTFDTVVGSELVEHFQDPKQTLAELERVSARRIIISTPNGFQAQGTLFGNPFERHLSGWKANNLRSWGYKVRGIGFKYGAGVLRTFFDQLAYILPLLSQDLVGMKDITFRKTKLANAPLNDGKI